MDKIKCAKIALFLSGLVLFVFTSCKKDESPADFHNGRKVYMSNNVNMQIFIPSTKDTIIYQDATSGFPIGIADGELFTKTYELSDTTMNGKKNMKITMEFDHFRFLNAQNDFKLDGKGVLYLKDRQAPAWQETIPFVILPLSGTIKGREITFTIASKPEDDLQEPYMVISYLGNEIR